MANKRVAKTIEDVEDEIDDEEFEEDEYEEDDEYYEERSRVIPFLLSSIALLAFIGLGWYAYQASSNDMSAEELMLVEAEQTPIKERPLEAGGMQFPHQDKSVFETIAGGDTIGANDATVINSAESPLVMQVPPTEGAPAMEEEVTSAAVVTTEPEPVQATEEIAAIEPAAGKPVSQPAISVKEVTPAEAPTLVTAMKPPSQKIPTAQNTGTQTVQLGAFKSEGDAQDAWNKVAGLKPLSGHSPNIVRADLGDKGVFYRLRVSGVDAKATCASLAGKSPCMPVK